MIHSLILILFLITFGNAKIAPDFIHPCDSTDPKCLIPASQYALRYLIAGVPEFGIPPLDPFEIDELDIPLNDIKLVFRKGKVYGFKNCIFDDMISKLKERFFAMDMRCNLTAEGQYETEGKLLSFSIKGDGPAKVEIPNLKLHLEFNTKYTKDKHGANHFSIKDYKYSFEFGGRVKFEIKDILKGNKEISEKIVEVMNKEWRSLAEEFGKPFVDYGVKLGVQYAEKFFSIVPYEELINVPIPL